jgi:hypothetical protein
VREYPGMSLEDAASDQLPSQGFRGLGVATTERELRPGQRDGGFGVAPTGTRGIDGRAPSEDA